MVDRRVRLLGLVAVICAFIGVQGVASAADKNSRLIGLYDITVHFQYPEVNWQEVSDAFVKQFLADTANNPCIQPSYLPERVPGSSEPRTPGEMEGTESLDYLAYGDLYLDSAGYHMEAFLVRGKDRLEVLKRVQPGFSDLKDAPLHARMAALNLRLDGSATRPLADLILDFEKKQRQENPQDHAIAPELKVLLADSDRYPLKLNADESRNIPLSLKDCDGVALKGAGIHVETTAGEVAPSLVTVGEDGSGQFTYKAPPAYASGQIRAGFTYLRGSERPGDPELQSIDVRVGRVTAWKGTVTYRVATPVTGTGPESTFTGREDESASYTGEFRRDPFSFSSDQAFRIENGTAQAKINDEYYEKSPSGSQRTTQNGQNSTSIPVGALLLAFSADGKSYSLESTRVDFPVQFTIFEVNKPKTVWQKASDLWSAEEFTTSDIPMPTEGERLAGSSRVTIPVGLRIGASAPVEAEVTWDFEPMVTSPAK